MTDGINFDFKTLEKGKEITNNRQKTDFENRDHDRKIKIDKLRPKLKLQERHSINNYNNLESKQFVSNKLKQQLQQQQQAVANHRQRSDNLAVSVAKENLAQTYSNPVSNTNQNPNPKLQSPVGFNLSALAYRKLPLGHSRSIAGDSGAYSKTNVYNANSTSQKQKIETNTRQNALVKIKRPLIHSNSITSGIVTSHLLQSPSLSLSTGRVDQLGSESIASLHQSFEQIDLGSSVYTDRSKLRCFRGIYMYSALNLSIW